MNGKGCRGRKREKEGEEEKRREYLSTLRSQVVRAVCPRKGEFENQPPRGTGAWQNSCKKEMKFFANGGTGWSPREHRIGTVSYRNFAGNKDASHLVGKFMLPSREKKCS